MKPKPLPGFPKGKAMALRLNALSQALNFLSRVGVDYVIFEDLFLVKKRKFTRSKSGNRKVSRFAKKKLLTHGVIKALRLCFNVVLVNPKGTTNSEDHDRVMREKGFDKHTASAYLLTLKGLGMLNNIKWRKIHGLSETVVNNKSMRGNHRPPKAKRESVNKD
jgi:hypothetical protein